MDSALEGWYTDPFGRHEARWISEGVPTALVRDRGVEGNDPPPKEPISITPTPVGREVGGVAGFRRADEAQEGEEYDRKQAARAQLEFWFDQGPSI